MTITIAAAIVALLVGQVIPFLVAVLTKLEAAIWLKQVLTAFLAAVSGLLVTATQLDGTAVLSRESGLLAIGVFIASQTAYVALYRPHDANTHILPEAGVG